MTWGIGHANILAMEADLKRQPIEVNPDTNLWVTDLKQIEKLTEHQTEANHKFVDFLKTKNSESLDKLVSSLSQNVASGIDCKSCANCCKSLTVAANYQDSAKVAAGLALEHAEFKAKYMKRDFEGDMVFKQRPCPFLKSNLCSVYENRPSTCRTYPHLEKGNFIGRIQNVLSNLKVCPIAYNTFELLKLNFE